MKYLFFFTLAFLIFEVSSQNPNMFEFNLESCEPPNSPACNAMGIFQQAGQIISDNLVLTKKIKVSISVVNADQASYYAFTSPFQVTNVDPSDGVVTQYPTALIKQVFPDYDYDGKDIDITVNSKFDGITWFGGNEPIQANQVDFLENILHELHHGLGIISTWGIIRNNNEITPAYDFETTNTGEIIFSKFDTTVFDKRLIFLDSATPIKSIVPILNNMAGPSGRTYSSIDDFHNQLLDEQHRQGVSYTTEMYNIVTTPKKLGFVQNSAGSVSDAIILDTYDNPYSSGTNIVHLDRNLYSTSPDFVFTPHPTLGKTLQQKIEAYGNAPGGGIGPHLRSMLETIGYQLRIPATAAKSTEAKSTESKSTTEAKSTESTKSKSTTEAKSTESTKSTTKRSKPKRIENYS